MNRLDSRTRTTILHSLCEGVSVRSISRIQRVDTDTVMKLLEDAGDMAIAFVKSELRDLTSEWIQADELYSFVGTRDFDPEDWEVQAGLGRTWTWLSLDAKSKLVINYHIGPRDRENAFIFAQELASRLKRRPDGKFEVMPTVVTDGLFAYRDAIQEAFGSNVNFGVAEKIYVNENRDGKPIRGQRYKETRRRMWINKPAEAKIHTSYIERQNLNLRMQNRRFTRKTNAFSKTLLNHERHLALWIVYHNFVWLPTRGGVSAATHHKLRPEIWRVEDLLELTDEFIAARDHERRKALARPKTLPKPKPVVPAGEPTYWVYRSLKHKTCKVHLATCANCRFGQGRKGADALNSEWTSYFSLEAATEAAMALNPTRTTICSMCIGSYRKRYRGKPKAS